MAKNRVGVTDTVFMVDKAGKVKVTITKPAQDVYKASRVHVLPPQQNQARYVRRDKSQIDVLFPSNQAFRIEPVPEGMTYREFLEKYRKTADCPVCEMERSNKPRPNSIGNVVSIEEVKKDDG